MLEGREFRELLIADVALIRGVASAVDVAAALQRYWQGRERDGASLSEELAHIARLDPEALRLVEAEVDRLVAAAGGDPLLALTRHGGLERSMHVALGGPGAADTVPLHTLDPKRYVSFALAGKGGMGAVYMALDTEMNRLVAFKVVRTDAAGPTAPEAGTSPLAAVSPSGKGTPASEAFETLRVRFLQEAWITGGMEHPGIVPVYEMGQTPGGVPYYTMRFVRGQRTLAQAIEEKRGAPFEDRVALLEPFLKLCDTVRYAHAKGVIHRDLKPENVALGEFGEVVLLDWGLAKLEGREDVAASRWQEQVREFREAGDLRTIAGILGTPGYMSPEAAAGRVEAVDARSDVYSLGAILFEVLTGRMPFEFKTFGEYLDKVAEEDAPAARTIEPAVPEALNAICARCLARERDSRLTRVEDVAEGIRAWQAASALEREVEGLLRDARAALDAAEHAQADARLIQVERAAGFLQQVETKRPGEAAVASERVRAASLRERAVRERERASGRRLLRRVGVGALAAATVAAFVVTNVIDGKRRETAEALVEVGKERDAKAKALDEILQLADAKRVHDLVVEADALWSDSDTLLMEPWVREAREVLLRRSTHTVALRGVLDRSLKDLLAWSEVPSTDADLVRYVEDNLIPTTSLTRMFPDLVSSDVAQAAWRAQVLAGVLKDLVAIEDPEDSNKGLLPRLVKRHAFLVSLKQRSIDDHAQLWKTTIEAIAASPRYRLATTPQLGLIPLGPDPDSGLYEFAHLGSGSIPKRDEATKRLVYADDAAIVLVLIPRGKFKMGAQKEDPNGPNHDPQAEGDESPVHDVRLSPYFLAKHEATQAQWKALTEGKDPSTFKAGQTIGDKLLTARNPVEQISWEDCDLWLSRSRLALPTAAQWEYACRAGSDAPWITGRDVAALGKVANIADKYFMEHGGPPTWQHTVEVDDGHTVHAPVGSFAANAFGLHDVHGNIGEWCRDAFRSYSGEALTDPRLEGSGGRVSRGGSWYVAARYARSSFRYGLDPGSRSDDLGVRPARPLDAK